VLLTRIVFVNRKYFKNFIITEILRMYPSGTRLERRCVKEYEMPDSDVKIPVGQLVVVSVQGIHRDEQYYTDPEKFDPERFTPENKASRPTYSYLPFGMGPRNCIGKFVNCDHLFF
jgi:cytochrome P450 family 6